MTEAFPQTTTSIDGLQIVTSSGELFNHVDNELPMWSGNGDREVRMDIQFEKAFDDLPSITLGLSGIDAAHDHNLRFRLSATDVKKTGFTIEFTTWGDTNIARASVSWQAVGPGVAKATESVSTTSAAAKKAPVPAAKTTAQKPTAGAAKPR